MDNETFLKLKRGDKVQLPNNQQRIIDCPPNRFDQPWNQVAIVTEPWIDHLSNRPTLQVQRTDIIS